MKNDDPHLLWVPLTHEEWDKLKAGKSLSMIVPAPITVLTGEPSGKDTLLLIQPPDFDNEEKAPDGDDIEQWLLRRRDQALNVKGCPETAGRTGSWYLLDDLVQEYRDQRRFLDRPSTD